MAIILGLGIVVVSYSLSRYSSPSFSLSKKQVLHDSSTSTHLILVKGHGSKLLQGSNNRLSPDSSDMDESEGLVSVSHLGASTLNSNSSLGLLYDMTRCSLSLGVSKKRLKVIHDSMVSTVQNATLLLASLKNILSEDKMILTRRNPCWRTSFKILINSVSIPRFKIEDVSEYSRNLSSLVEDNAKCLEPNECIHCLPYFFIAGFAKCGTTSLHTALSKHPQIVPPMYKEPHWWSNLPLGDFSPQYLRARTMLYLQYFESASSQNNKITYDASQSLLFGSPFKDDYCLNAAVVSRMVPNAKFIVIMRNPVDRLYSGYFAFSKDYSKWPASMQQNAALYFHLKAEEAIGQFKDCLSQGNSSYECSTVELRNWMKVKKKNRENSNVRPSLGIYYIYVLKWIQFYPIENFLFLKTEDMAHNPTAVMRDITDFLGIQSVSEESVKTWFSGQRNSRSTSIKDKYGDMMPKTRKLLIDFYAPHNKQLVELVGDERFLWSQ